MKKTALMAIAAIAVIVLAAHYADKATRLRVSGVTFKKGDSPAAGKPAPDFTLKDLDGKNVHLSQYKGKVVLVHFWATWCDPCREEIPWLIEMQQKYSAKGFTVLGIAMDEEGKSVVAPFVEKEQFEIEGGSKSLMNYPIVIGDEQVVDKFGGLFGYPTSVLISRDGKQIKRITGLISYDEIAQAIESQL
jgi:thiol-disulfide isomerase/thioredoxin